MAWRAGARLEPGSCLARPLTVAQFPELLRARRGSLCFLKISKQPLIAPTPARCNRHVANHSHCVAQVILNLIHGRKHSGIHRLPLSVLYPAFSVSVVHLSPLRSDQCEEAKLSPTGKRVDSERTTGPFDALESTT